MSPGALTVPQAAAYLEVSDRTVYRLIEQHRLPAKRLGRSLRVPRAYLDEWLESGEDRLPVLAESSTGLDLGTQVR